MILLLVLSLVQQKDPNPTQVTFFTWDTYRFAADLEDEGDVAIYHGKFSFDLRQFLSRQDMLLLQNGMDYVRYDFSDTTADLWEDVYIFRSDLVYMRFFNETWYGLVYGSIYDSFEKGADKSDGLSFGGGIGLLYNSGPDFMLGAALRGVTRIEESPYFFLVPQIDWKFAPDWRVKTENRSAFTLTLSRQLDPAWAAEARVHYWLRRFRLDEDSFVTEGVVQDDRVSFEVGVKWTPSETVWAGLHVGLDLWQEYIIEAKNGNDIDEVTTDSAPYIALSLSASF
ncbi:MAG TPA: hypothetical protein VF950_20085 [Planctomycetota bacterium]